MATKTLILRPTSNAEAFASGFPSDVAAEEYYSLFNEETADDDATYIYMNTALSGILVGFTVPDGYTHITPLAIRLVIRTKTTHSSGYEVVPELRYGGADGGTSYLQAPVDNLDVYETYSLESPDPSNLWNRLLSENHPLILSMVALTESSSKSTFEIRYTQVYIEIDYEDSDAPSGPIPHIKQNGQWIAASKIYRKSNGSWIECDSSSLTNGTQYTVLHLNST